MKVQLLVLSILLSLTAFSQKLNMDLVKDLKPRSIGPAGMAGRVTAIDVVTSDPSVMYVGTASGGLWKSESAGVTWTPIFEKETTAAIGSVAIQQSNPDVIWVGTGEGNPRNSLNGGDGIYKSLDGGRSWKKMGLANTRNIHRVIVHPTNPDIVYAAAIGSPWGAHPERGVYRTKDGGKTWERILFTNEKSGCADLVIDPANPNKLVAAMWEHQRQPWFFTSGGPGSGLYISFDGGDTWAKRGKDDGLPEGELGRIGLAISPANPRFIYALVEAKKNGLYRSEDGGFKWQKISEDDGIGDRPFYYSDIFADPENEYRLYTIFTYVNVSHDGGKSFSQLMPAYNTSRGVHPDHHAFWVHPTDPDFLIEGNDGGLNISRDRGKTWRFIQNLPVAQFYHINYDMDTPYNVYGGMQDNGSWAGPAYAWRDQSIRNTYWQEISFGDGFDVVPDPEDSRYGYSMSQEGWVGRYDKQTGHFESIKPQNPELLPVKLRFNWNAAIAQDPFDAKAIYFGSQFVHRSTDKGKSWTIISPDLTTNDKSKQNQTESGGLTMDATGAENHCTIIALAPSPLDKQVIWAGTDDGNIQVTQDGGKTWTNVAKNIKGMPASAWVPQIRASSYSVGEALVIVNNYRQFDFKPYAYRTTNFGKTWERIVDETDVMGYTLSIIQDPVEPRLFFLGTDDGLYISIDQAATWAKWTNGFPSVNVMDLAIHPREGDLIIGTFGRAAWILDDLTPLREAAKSSVVLSESLQVFSPPTAYLASIQQPHGFRFGADAEFAGENRTTDARISYVINRPTLSEEEKKNSKINYDSVSVTISNKNNEIIRILKLEAPKENGVHRLTWSLNERGVYSLSRNELNKKREPSGQYVLPETYGIKLTFGDKSDSTTLEVKADPRLNQTDTDRQAIYDSLRILYAFQQLALDRVERLKGAIASISTLEERMKAKNEKAFSAELTTTKTQRDSLDLLLNLYVGKEDNRQGITEDPVLAVDDHIGLLEYYLSASLRAPGDTEKRMMTKVRNAVLDANAQTDAYFDKYWSPFKAQMEALNLSPFED